tara:strand:- start:2212 stop:3927 length:1716 start_codon:yes stop_codon:yes gene_type:complete
MASTPLYTVPTDFKSGLSDVLAESKNIYEAKKAQGYMTYPGAQIAGFSPEEQAAMTGIAGMVGQGQQYFAPAAGLYAGQAQQFTPQTAQQYMSPYQQAVVDVEKREAIRQSQRPMQEIGSAAVTAGGFGGSRQAILEAEAGRNLQTQLGNIQTKGQQASFENAQKAFEAQKKREQTAATGLTSLGQLAPRQQLTELTALSGIGEAQRGMTQQGLDLAYQNFLQQQQLPYDLLGQYQATLYGYPYQSTQQYQPKAQASSSQNLAAVLGAGAKVFGGGGGGFGFNTGGRIAFQSKGGLSEVVKQMAVGMTVGSGEDITPAGQAEAKKDYLKNLLEAMTGQAQATKKYGEISTEVMAEQQRMAEERQKKLEASSSPMNYIGDLLIGYGAADPEAGLGVQLAGAATYAEEQKQTIQDEITKVQSEVLAGRLSQAEAEVKLEQLGVKSAADLYDIMGPVDVDFKSETELVKRVKAMVPPGMQSMSITDSIAYKAIDSAQERLRGEAAESPSKYKDNKAAQETRMNELLIEEVTKLLNANKKPNPTTNQSSVSGAIQSGTEEIDEIIANATPPTQGS